MKMEEIPFVEDFESDGFSQTVATAPKPDEGMTLKIKDLYRSHPKEDWDEWIPDNIGENVAEYEDSKQCALVVRHEKLQGQGRFGLHSIVVQSPLLRKPLGNIFVDYEGISTELKNLKFSAPFHEFYYRWHRFETACKDEYHGETKEHLQLLHSVVGKEILPHVESMQDLTQHGLITYEYLWTIFPPGMDIFSKSDGEHRLYQHKSSLYRTDMSGRDTYFHLSCRYIDCDGVQFGYVETSLAINVFQGVKKITDLIAYPSYLHTEPEELLKYLHDRGEKFEQLNGCHHMSYNGRYIEIPDDRRRVAKLRHVRLSTRTATALQN